jgi:hypothetical protein
MLEFAHFVLILYGLVDYFVSAVSSVLAPHIVAAILPDLFLQAVLAVAFVLAGLALIRLLAVLTLIVRAFCGALLTSAVSSDML